MTMTQTTEPDVVNPFHKMLLPSDEMHFLRWFWHNASKYAERSLVDESAVEYEIDHLAALIDYEKDFGRYAPRDYHAMIAA